MQIFNVVVFWVHKYRLYCKTTWMCTLYDSTISALGYLDICTLIFVRLFKNCNFWVWYVKKWERNWLDRPDQRVCDCLSVRAVLHVLLNMWLILSHPRWLWVFPSGSAGKASACNTGDAGDWGSIPDSGRSPGVENDNPLQHSYLKNSMDRGAWQAIVHGVTGESHESDMIGTTEHRTQRRRMLHNTFC